MEISDLIGKYLHIIIKDKNLTHKCYYHIEEVNPIEDKFKGEYRIITFYKKRFYCSLHMHDGEIKLTNTKKSTEYCINPKECVEITKEEFDWV